MNLRGEHTNRIYKIYQLDENDPDKIVG